MVLQTDNEVGFTITTICDMITQNESEVGSNSILIFPIDCRRLLQSCLLQLTQLKFDNYSRDQAV